MGVTHDLIGVLWIHQFETNLIGFQASEVVPPLKPCVDGSNGSKTNNW